MLLLLKLTAVAAFGGWMLSVNRQLRLLRETLTFKGMICEVTVLLPRTCSVEDAMDVADGVSAKIRRQINQASRGN